MNQSHPAFLTPTVAKQASRLSRLGGVALGMVLLNAAITQWTAARLFYHPALTDRIAGHLYWPWAWLRWQFLFPHSASATWKLANGGLLGSFLLVCFALIVLRGDRRSPHKQEGLHGTAHWATEEEIRASGLLPEPGETGQGVYVGGWTDPVGNLWYLRHNGPEHIAVIAPTRSGKGVGLVVPTLLSWPYSCVVNDQKLELWNMTAGWRARQANNRCLLFNPGADTGSVSYNPVQEIRVGTVREVADAQNLATMLVDPDGKGLIDHWAKTSHAFLTAALLHLLHKNRLRVATFFNAARARAVAVSIMAVEAQLDAKRRAVAPHSSDESHVVPDEWQVVFHALARTWHEQQAVTAWDILDENEQAAVRLYAQMPEETWANEFRQWTDEGARWKTFTGVGRRAITAFNGLSSEAQRAELRRQAASRPTVSLPDLALALSDPRRPIDELYAEMIENTHDVTGLYVADYPEVIKHAGHHPVVAAGAAAMLNRPDDERGSVLSTAQSFLALYADPIVAKNTRHSDFTISDLMNSQTPLTLYLAAREEDKDRLKPLMRLIINQIVRILLRPELRYVEGRPVAPHVHRLLLMLDEFPSYGKLEVFEEALSYLAGYGIKAYLIMQDVEQLYKAYGENESLTSNCHIRVAYAPNKLKTAQWLSLMTGKMTVNTEEYTESGKRFGVRLDSVSRTWKATERELLTADEVMRLKAPAKDENGNITAPGHLLVFTAGQAPIYGTQSLYFRDPVFVARVKNPPPTQADSTQPETPTLSTKSPKGPVGETVPAKAVFILNETPQQDTALRGCP